MEALGRRQETASAGVDVLINPRLYSGGGRTKMTMEKDYRVCEVTSKYPFPAKFLSKSTNGGGSLGHARTLKCRPNIFILLCIMTMGNEEKVSVGHVRPQAHTYLPTITRKQYISSKFAAASTSSAQLSIVIFKKSLRRLVLIDTFIFHKIIKYE